MRKFRPQYLEKKSNRFNRNRNLLPNPHFQFTGCCKTPHFLTWAQGKVRTLSRRRYFKGKESRAAVENSHRTSPWRGLPVRCPLCGPQQAASGFRGGFTLNSGVFTLETFSCCQVYFWLTLHREAWWFSVKHLDLKALLKIKRPQPNTIRQAIQRIFRIKHSFVCHDKARPGFVGGGVLKGAVKTQWKSSNY